MASLRIKRLTKKQKGFADDYLETNEPTMAALKNYNCESMNYINLWH